MSMMKLIAHIIILAVCNAAVEGLISIEPSLPLGCKKQIGTYYDPTMLSCEKCPTGSEPNTELTGCDCKAGFKKVPSPATKERIKKLSAK